MSIIRENIEARSAGLPHEEETGAANASENFEVEREQQHMEEAFLYLTESGRAKNREDAERYLSKLTTVKEKLIGFLRERLLTQKSLELYSDPYKPEIRYGTWENVAERNKAAMENITVRNIDRTNPELWKIKRVFEPSYIDYLPEVARSLGKNTSKYADIVMVAFNKGENAEILPDFLQHGKITLSELGKYLTEDELEFVKQDYAFALKDLERVLRATADHIPETAGWAVFAPRQEER